MIGICTDIKLHASIQMCLTIKLFAHRIKRLRERTTVYNCHSWKLNCIYIGVCIKNESAHTHIHTHTYERTCTMYSRWKKDTSKYIFLYTHVHIVVEARQWLESPTAIFIRFMLNDRAWQRYNKNKILF